MPIRHYPTLSCYPCESLPKRSIFATESTDIPRCLNVVPFQLNDVTGPALNCCKCRSDFAFPTDFCRAQQHVSFPLSKASTPNGGCRQIFPTRYGTVRSLKRDYLLRNYCCGLALSRVYDFREAKDENRNW